MTTLDSSFETDLREAVLDSAEARLVGEQANLIFELVELVHTRLRAYAKRNGYDVESTIDSLGTPEVTRTGDKLTITIGWESEQMMRWEFGVSPHTIDGDPVLSFVWEDPPQWVRDEFDQARAGGGQFRSGWRVFLPSVEHPGIPESRAIRDALRAFRKVLRN
ncbi:MAG: hypothetical protein V5A30_05965 [Haloarculaceae archaeon]